MFSRATFYEPICASTNSLAKAYIAQGVPLAEGSVLITNNQYQGRGQRGNTWFSEPAKNLTCSVVLYPSFLKKDSPFSLNIMTSLAIYDVLVQYIPKGLAIKWPNDIYYFNKKLGGILIENGVTAGGTIKSSIIGIGLNINQDEFKTYNTTSLKSINSQNFNLSHLLNGILNQLGNYYSILQDKNTSLLPIYLEKLYGYNQVHNFTDKYGPFQGKIRHINCGGNLLISKEDGSLYYYAPKEVIFETISKQL